MADSADTPSSVASNKSSPAEQARIRKERREAKLKNGSARLNKIIGLGGGLPREEQPTAGSTPDPEEVDISISEHYYDPNSSSASSVRKISSSGQQNLAPQQQQQQMTDDQLRQIFQGFDAPPPDGTATGTNPFAGGGFPGMGGPGQGADDPMMKLLQQMMGGLGGGEGGIPSFPTSETPPAQEAPNRYTYIWTILHFLSSLTLGIYISISTSFTGSKLSREGFPTSYPISPNSYPIASAQKQMFFYYFATAELILLTSRFFLEKGGNVQTGWLGTVMGFLPPKWRTYVEVVLRYGKVWTQVSGDAMVVVFMLGVVGWLRGGVA